MENIIGSILVSERLKDIGTMYQIVFTDSRVVALMVDPSKELYKAYTMLAVGGIVSGWPAIIEQRKRMMKTEEIFIDINKSKKSIVSYEKQELSDEMIGRDSVIIPYDKIKRVIIKKAVRENAEPEKLRYSIIFEVGVLSSENFMFPGVGVDEVTALVKKTPLSSKIA